LGGLNWVGIGASRQTFPILRKPCPRLDWAAAAMEQSTQANRRTDSGSKLFPVRCQETSLMSRALLLVAFATLLIAVRVLSSAEPGEVPNVRPADLGAVVVQEPERAKERVEFIDIDRFLPAGLVKPVDRSFDHATLESVLNAIGEVAKMAVWPDVQTLKDAGVTMDTPVSGQVDEVPAYIALNRLLRNVNGVELQWLIRDEQLFVTTAEAATEFTEAVLIDLTPLIALGYEPQGLVKLIESSFTGGNWKEHVGEGGGCEILGATLMVRNTYPVINRVRCLLAALQSNASTVWISRSEMDSRAFDARNAIFDCDFMSVSLADVAAAISKRLDVPVELDVQKLSEAGVLPDASITLRLQGLPLRLAANRLLDAVNGVKLAIVVKEGRLLITTQEATWEWEYVAVFDISTLHQTISERSLCQMILDGTSDEISWWNTDGEGGAVLFPRPQTMILRSSQEGLEQVERLIKGLRDSAELHPPTKAPEPITVDTVEVRRFAMTLGQAKDLQRVLPELVSPESWTQLPRGDRPLIETIARPSMSIPCPANSSESERIAADPAATPAVLIIRQTRGVQEQIRKFVVDLQRFPLIEYGGGMGGLGSGGMGGSSGQ
jgi:hypothetical protein